MANAELWKKRVEDWRASGLSAAEYCKSQEFTKVQGVRVLVPPGADVATVGVVLEALGVSSRSVAR